jgi:spore maturation protein CgeB
MRWLVIHPGPNFSVSDVYSGWVEALRDMGEHVIEYNLDKRLQFFDSALMETDAVDGQGRQMFRKAVTREEAIMMAAEGIMAMCYRTWPDVVLGVSAFFTPPQMLDILRSRKHKVVLLHTESPYQDNEQLERASHADINLLNDPINIQRYLDLGIPAYYMPHAYRPEIHYPGKGEEDLESDFVFVGTGFKSRIEFFEAMDLEGIDVALGGPWPDVTSDSPLSNYILDDKMIGSPGNMENVACLDNPLTAIAYRSSRVGINFYRRESEALHKGEGWAMGPREVEMAACGLFFLRDPRPESDETFPMLPTFDGPEDASEKLRWYLAHDNERETAALAAREAIAGRNFERNAKNLIRYLSELK